MNNNKITAFNLRAYAIIIANGKILLSKELIKGKEVIKFPGGGVEFGEGIIATLKREAMEEMNSELHNIQHFYTTEFFQQSQFKKSDQLISIYFTANILTFPYVFNSTNKPKQDKPLFFWESLKELNKDLFHFPIDKHVCNLIKEI